MRLEYFQMIDRVADFDAAARVIRCESTVPQESPVFEGHFPGHPLMPGVLLIETMAQAAGYLTLGLNRFEKMPFLAGVKEAKMRSFMAPGARLDVFAELEHEGSGFVVAKTRIASEDTRVCDGVLMFRLMPFPTPEFAVMMRRQAATRGMRTDP